MLGKFAIFVIGLLAVTCAQQPHLNPNENTPEKKVQKRSYVCPPNFIRLSHRCYFFSKEAATWQDAYFQCRDLHSNLAVVRNSNQDKLIRRFLSKRTLAPLERWLGGLYDWEQMTWKWGSSGKPLVYQGFSRMDAEDKEKLRWHCIIVDPHLQYKWNTRSCLEQKQFICHTKIKIVTNKGKKKLLRQYNVDKFNKLNEIPVPTLPDDVNYNITRLKDHQPRHVDVTNAEFAVKAKERRRKAKRNGRKKKKNVSNNNNIYNNTNYPAIAGYDYSNYNYNSSYVGFPEVRQGERWRRQKNKEDNNFSYNNDHEKNISMEHIKWKTYFKNITLSPLHPKPIVEEFNYVKDA